MLKLNSGMWPSAAAAVLTDVSVHHLGTEFAHSLQVVDLPLEERYLGFQVLILGLVLKVWDKMRRWEKQTCQQPKGERGRGGERGRDKTTHHLFLPHGLTVGARASDVEERLLLGGGEWRRWSADITPSGGGKWRGGGGLSPPTWEAFCAGRGADRPGALACDGETKRERRRTGDRILTHRGRAQWTAENTNTYVHTYRHVRRRNNVINVYLKK